MPESCVKFDHLKPLCRIRVGATNLGAIALPAAPFARKYTPIDIALLVEMDKAHEDTCGPAIIHLLKRAYHEYGDAGYERLAELSSSHLYNLRKSVGYQSLRVSFTKTHPVCNSIGVRKAPCPDGRAGFVRIDSVHQGDEDGMKGVYHITCVDSVSQWQVEACVQGISEAFLLPVLELVIEQFPFVIEGFHSDNGSEYMATSVISRRRSLKPSLRRGYPPSAAGRVFEVWRVVARLGRGVRTMVGLVHDQKNALQQCFHPSGQ